MGSCFVVQGFGRKTDFTDGRVLDLDASYAVIKEAVEAAGLECVRADEIAHSGAIDVPMYRQLCDAELVIADLSTYNVNAAFELGVRYGLRPRATIIVAEEGFKNPFDVGHIAIRRYKHLGEDIGAKEARRFRDELARAIRDILAAAATDSPVYTFLPELLPPQREAPAAASTTPRQVLQSQRDEPESAKAQLDAALDLIRRGEFRPARDRLAELCKQRGHDDFVVQQYALATYKARDPTPEAALDAARSVLLALAPDTTNDPETLGLWGAIHKRLWELAGRAGDLAASVAAYERGFRLKQDPYNGINYACLLETRALAELRAGRRDDGIADRVLAGRVRREVLACAEARLADELTDDQRYWMLATLAEAAAGLGDHALAEARLGEADALPVAGWMRDSTREQLARIAQTQGEIAALIDAGN